MLGRDSIYRLRDSVSDHDLKAKQQATGTSKLTCVLITLLLALIVGCIVVLTLVALRDEIWQKDDDETVTSSDLDSVVS